MTDTVTALFESECSGHVPHFLGAWDSLPARREPENLEEQLRQSNLDHADALTRKARDEIKKLRLDDMQACALISTLIAVIVESSALNNEKGESAVEYLLDAHMVLERGVA